MENKKDKKTKSILSALSCLGSYTQIEMEHFENRLKDPKQKNQLLKELQLPIKKGMLIKKIVLVKIDFNIDLVSNCNSIESLLIIEKQMNLKAKKEDLIRKINKKKLPIQRQWLKDIMLSESMADLNKVLEGLPTAIKLHLGQLKHLGSGNKSSSINPIYTPMGNKR